MDGGGCGIVETMAALVNSTGTFSTMDCACVLDFGSNCQFSFFIYFAFWTPIVNFCILHFGLQLPVFCVLSFGFQSSIFFAFFAFWVPIVNFVTSLYSFWTPIANFLDFEFLDSVTLALNGYGPAMNI